jgi:hypothetical protein
MSSKHYCVPLHPREQVQLATGLDHEWVCSKLAELSQRFGTVVQRSDRGMRIDLQS